MKSFVHVDCTFLLVLLAETWFGVGARGAADPGWQSKTCGKIGRKINTLKENFEFMNSTNFTLLTEIKVNSKNIYQIFTFIITDRGDLVIHATGARNLATPLLVRRVNEKDENGEKCSNQWE